MQNRFKYTNMHALHLLVSSQIAHK